MSDFSMFEILMGLPLFHGASREQITTFVEKAQLDFSSYEPGDEIVRTDSRCRTLKCLISGDCEIQHHLFSDNMVLREVSGRGRFLSAGHLFGLNNKFNFSVQALTRCGTLDISKSQYFEMLQRNSIFLLNYLNFLSLGVQRFEDLFLNTDIENLYSILKYIIEACTTRESRRISIETVNSSLSEFFSSRFKASFDQLKKLDTLNIIRIIDEHRIDVPDRLNFLAFSS